MKIFSFIHELDNLTYTVDAFDSADAYAKLYFEKGLLPSNLYLIVE